MYAQIVVVFFTILSQTLNANPIGQKSAFQKGKYFDRVITTVFENVNIDHALADPNFKSLADECMLLTNYKAVTHPSQGNYVAMIAGDIFNIVSSDIMYDLPVTSIADTLEENGISWATYQENYPTDKGCFAENATADGLYVRKHNPFMSMDNIRLNQDRCLSRIKPASDLGATGGLEQYVFYTPNMDNDAHDTNITFAGEYLEPLIKQFKALIADDDKEGMKSVIVVTFDEDEGWFEEPSTLWNENRVYTAICGKHIQPSVDNTPYTHYDLLRMVQDNWNLPSLGRNDETAPGIKLNLKHI